MAEPPGAHPALGIDAVEWVATAEGTVTVIVSGRWRRRPVWRGRPVLVIGWHGRRYNFPAIAEPPSVAGASPGTWRMTFRIPARLAPGLGGQCWLQLGAMFVSLPGVVTPATPAPTGGGSLEGASSAVGLPDAVPMETRPLEGTPMDPEPMEPEPLEPGPLEPEASEPEPLEPEPPEPEPVEPRPVEPAADLGERIQQLERERRAAEQRARAEHDRRLEVEIQLAALQEARASPRQDQLSAEVAIARGVPPASGPPRALDRSAVALAQAQLERERAMIATAAHDRTAELERELRDQAIRAELLYEVIDELRVLLDQIRGVDDAELSGEAAGSETGGVESVRLDAALVRLRETVPPLPSEEDAPASEAGRAFGSEGEASASGATASDADVSSLAEQRSEAERSPEAAASPARSPIAEPTRKSWLRRALRTIAKDDPTDAGRIVLGLLPAIRLAYSDPVAFDLVLADVGCLQVTARESPTQVTEAPSPRRWSDVDFRVTGESATLARLILAGRVRRRFGRRMAQFDGERKALSALTSLVRTPLGLRELYRAGVRLDPSLAFALAAATIEGRADDSHRFTIAHRGLTGPGETVYLKVSGAARPSVTDAPPLGPVATTIVCEPPVLLGVLVGEDRSRAVVRGATEPLELLRDWLQRAQSG